MKKLLLKDFFCLRYETIILIIMSCAILIFLGVTDFITGVVDETVSNDYSNFAFAIQVFSWIVGITVNLLAGASGFSSFRYDNMSKFDTISTAFPVDKKDIIMSKYIQQMIYALAGVVLLIIFIVIICVKVNIKIELSFFVPIYVSAFIMQLFVLLHIRNIYKFGLKKSHSIITIVSIISIAIVLGIITVFLLKGSLWQSMLDFCLEKESLCKGVGIAFLCIIPFIFAIVYRASFKSSMKHFSNDLS